jgi:3-oxoacyl-[acyl-carrier-protein] synthase-3
LRSAGRSAQDASVRSAIISGTGAFLPPRVVTNQDLVDVFGIDTSHDWIVQRTGIEERRFAAAGLGPADLAVQACKDAVDRAKLQLKDIDLIVFATLSPEFAFPGSGVFLQEKLGLVGVPAMDVRNQCSGFMYALATAAAMVRAGSVRNALVVGAEVHSAALDLTTRGRAVSTLFGDGAGAVVVSASDEPERGILSWTLGADGRFAESLAQRVWDTRQRPFIPLDENGNGVVAPELMWAQMDGRQVFKHAVEKMCLTLVGLCWDHKLAVEDLDYVFFHQANLRINQAVQQQLGLPDAKTPSTIHKYGNTTAATLPILLAESDRAGQLTPGKQVALVAFGSGFTWGGALIRW